MSNKRNPSRKQKSYQWFYTFNLKNFAQHAASKKVEGQTVCGVPYDPDRPEPNPNPMHMCGKCANNL